MPVLTKDEIDSTIENLFGNHYVKQQIGDNTGFKPALIAIVQGIMDSGRQLKYIQNQHSCIQIGVWEGGAVNFTFDETTPISFMDGYDEIWKTKDRKIETILEGIALVEKTKLNKIAEQEQADRKRYLTDRERIRDVNARFNAIPQEMKDHFIAFMEYMSLPRAESGKTKDQNPGLHTSMGTYFLSNQWAMAEAFYGRRPSFSEKRITEEDIKWEDYDHSKQWRDR